MRVKFAASSSSIVSRKGAIRKLETGSWILGELFRMESHVGQAIPRSGLVQTRLCVVPSYVVFEAETGDCGEMTET